MTTLTDKQLNDIRKDIAIFIRWKMNSETEVEDLTQDTLIRIITNLNAYDDSKNFRTWYISIANNLIIDHYRKNKERMKEFSVADFVNENGTEKIQIADASASIDRSNNNADLHRQIRSAIKDLKYEYRRVIILWFIQNMSVNEIAEYCEMPLNSVLSMIRRGKMLLQSKLQGQLA